IFDEIRLFSYDARDHALIGKLRDNHPAFRKISALTPARSLGARLVYSLLGPVQHRRAMGGTTTLRTNQISGSWSAVIAKLISKRPLVLRLGYLLSRRHGLNGQLG